MRRPGRPLCTKEFHSPYLSLYGNYITSFCFGRVTGYPEVGRPVFFGAGRLWNNLPVNLAAATSPTSWYLVACAAGAVLLLLLLIARVRLHPALALAVAALALGVASGMPLKQVPLAFTAGVGNLMGHIAIVLGFGAVLGRLLAGSGGAAALGRVSGRELRPERPALGAARSGHPGGHAGVFRGWTWCC